MSSKQKKIEAVDVYLSRRKSREYVGRLSHHAQGFMFTYDNSYLFRENSIPLGPDLPLTQQKFISTALFPTFEDRIPSNKNPAYKEYCQMVGISPTEKDPLTLVATLGQKGPSSFIFAPAIASAFTGREVAKFRKDLNLTIREFSELFSFSTATINKIEKQIIPGKDVLKRLEIYLSFPEVALYEATKNRHKINSDKMDLVEELLRLKINHKAGSKVKCTTR